MTIKRIPAGFALSAEDAPRETLLKETAVRGAALAHTRAQRHRILNAADGTRQLITWGCWIMLTGLLAGMLTGLAFGGVGPEGAHSNAGWLSLMVAMMSTPFAILLLLLGGAKWLRNYGLSKG